MIKALALLAGLNNTLTFVIAVLYIYSTLSPQDTMNRAETRRLSLSLGLMLVFMSISFGVIFYTGGLTAYLTRGGDPALGWAALVARALAAVTGPFVVFELVWIWREVKQRGIKGLE